MTRKSMLLCLAAAAALAGCNKEDHTIVAGPETADNQANVATNAPIELPPPIAASKTYRCTDNSVVYIDWLADNKTANIRTETNGEPTQVVAPEAGKPMTGTAGFTLTGSATASSITLVRPGHASTSCKA